MYIFKHISLCTFSNLSKLKVFAYSSYFTFSKNFSTTKTFSNNNSLLPVDLAFFYYKPDNKTVSSIPIIILHGFLGSKQNWRSISKAISIKTSRPIYVLDARNHGDSPHSEEFSISLMSEDLKHFMNKHYITEAILMGHSMGGRTAIHFAITYEDLVNKLIVVDISPNKLPLTSTLSPKYMTIMKEAITTVGGLSLYQARKIIDKYLAKTIPESHIRQFLLTNLAEQEKQIKWKPNLDALMKNFETGVLEMPEFTTHFMKDTLFLCGEKSPFVSWNDYPQIKALFPKAEILRIEGAGHWIHAEKPAEFMEAVCNFI